ncbi:MAG: acetylxylan esterase [Planctomycetaceae bacterium]|nr:acetylxylan esterase [Planctomycetaceae bacterium]
MRNQLALIGISIALIVTQTSTSALGQFNYDEAKVPKFELPKLLVSASGKKIATAADWKKVRRPEIFKLFQDEMYGAAPGRPEGMTFKVFESSDKALGGKATRKQVRVQFVKDNEDAWMDILIYTPNKVKGAVPGFLGLNFNGNHSVVNDPAIPVTPRWVRSNGKGVVKNKASEAGRGGNASRWAIDSILDAGYALITVYCGDLDEDYKGNFQNGVQPLFYKKGQTEPSPSQWGTISVWAWGLSRTMDYLETDDDIDHKKIAVMGHSRLGKTALWAGASDERFAIVISNNSGCGGAALSRREFGETVRRINTSFPHWFCGNFKKYNDNVNALPIDQHMLVALIAPRPAYIASAVEDRWADPRGEFLSAKHAEPVYALFEDGATGVGAKKWPGVDKPVSGIMGYHIRTGAHDVTEYDWQQYIHFANRHFGR